MLYLFGGDRPWSAADWTASDDRVRGGKSQSFLDCDARSPVATFRGNLDIKTLGGAGFASQRTTGEDRVWNLKAYDGLLLDLPRSDGKRYTLTLKDELLPRRGDGREQSSVSWEYDFRPDVELRRAGRDEASPAASAAAVGGAKGVTLFVKWADLKATYRGREKDDAVPLQLDGVRRISLMMRSFFGDQEGDFTLDIRSIAAVSTAEARSLETSRSEAAESRSSMQSYEKPLERRHNRSWLKWATGGCGLL